MKRKHKQQYKDLYRFFPLFTWYKCEKCGQDFRREKGWRALCGPYPGGAGRWLYLCGSCARTLNKADQYFLNMEWMPVPPRHMPPPPPPPVPLERIVKAIPCQS